MAEEQNLKNHSRIVPAFHMGVFFPFILNFFWAIYQLIQGVNAGTVIGLLTAIALLLLFFTVRAMILTVQDRVIRLEMRLRLRGLLPPDLLPRVNELDVKQLIALRFASDVELPELVREVLAGNCRTQKEIKQRVKSWQSDYLRA